jgi:hypothetical protein
LRKPFNKPKNPLGVSVFFSLMTNFDFGIKTNRFFVLMVFGKTGGEQFLGANGF